MRALLVAATALALAGCSSHPVAAARPQEGAPCDDRDPCTGGDHIVAGVCTGAPVVCAESFLCHKPGTCDPASGACSYELAPEGTPCDDGDACVAAAACDGQGECHARTARSCNPPDACHEAGLCDPTTGSCSFPALPDGSRCDDGDACTRGDSCQTGSCNPGDAVVCADGSRSAPAPSCAALHGAASGTYWLVKGGGETYQAYCDMETDGGGWARVRTLMLPDTSTGWASPVDVPYLLDLADPPAHDRVLVKLTLDDRSAWVSWDASGPSPYLPFGPPLQGDLPRGRAGSGADGRDVDLRIQSWPYTYSPNNVSQLYGWGNYPGLAPPDYGTFAFFDGTAVLFAVDRWAGGGTLDMGIGPAPAGHPDWTFAANAGTYATRKLEWFVGSGAAPDDCHQAEGCDPATGSCSFAPLLDGTLCDDHDACTYAESCRSGICGSGTDGCGRLDHVLLTGQSLSTGALSEILSDVQPYANVSFQTGVRAGGVGLTAFQPLVESWNGGEGETIASGMANLTWALGERSGAHPVPLLLSADGVSGQPYSALKKGTTAYANGLAQIAAARALADTQGKAYAVRAVLLVHGESDHVIGNTAYEANLTQWQSDYEADARALSGQSDPVPLFLCQMSSWGILGSATSRIPEDQLAAARDHPGKIFVVGPKYFLPYADGLHLTGTGERWLGEYHARAFQRLVREGKSWTPLQPGKVSRKGATIAVDFQVPAPPLVLDTESVTDPGHMGFEYTDDGPAPPAIQSVALTGPTQVTITLAAPPTGGNKRLRYAYTAVPGQWSGPKTGPRGNLRDSDATASLHGYPLWNWCVHFDEPVP